MKLDHIALYVDDLEAMKSFYTCHLAQQPTTNTATRTPG